MKKQISQLAIGLLTLTAFFTSCKKHTDDVVSPATPVCRVTSFKDLVTKDSTVQMFDSQNRLVKAISYDETGKLLDGYDVYTYTANKMTYTMYSDATTIAQQTQYVLNPNGTVHYDAETKVDNANGVTEYDTSFYTYDSQGYNTMVVYKTAYKGTHNNVYYDTLWSTYTDGNMTSTTIKHSSGETKTDIYTYTNLIDKAYLLSGGLSNMNDMYGIPSKNLLLLGTDAAGSYTEKYTYEMNAEGYLTRRRMEYVNTKYPSPYTNDMRFYYTCN